jgi:hypothetical protein
MAQYKVENALLDGFKVGDVVSESDFAQGINIEALVEGGFLSVSGKLKSTFVAEPAAEENTKG